MSCYFAYGSNLNRADFERWCRERSLDASLVRMRSRAWLPDHELVFHYRSAARDGGALDVRGRRGTATPGALFEVEGEGWAILDRKEGVEVGHYQRQEVSVLDERGGVFSATTYRVHPSRREGHIPPRGDYLELVRRGLRSLELPVDSLLAAAEARESPGLPSALFVYGTLMRGEARAELMLAHGPSRVIEGSVGGRLLRLGWYPGLVEPLAQADRVRGEVFFYDAHDALMAELDEYEDFLGYRDGESLYHRTLVRVATAEGEALAWTYHYVGDRERASRIDSGCWRSRD